MTDEPNNPSPPDEGDPAPPANVDATRAGGQTPRTDDKAPSAGREMADAGSTPPPDSDQPRPTPESQAALTGKAPSGSSVAGTTVPASSGESGGPEGAPPAPKKPAAAPANETPEEKKARLDRIIAEAKARNAAKAAAKGADADAAQKPTAEAKKTAEGASETPAPAAEAPTSAAGAETTKEPPGGKSPAVGDPTQSPSQADLEKAAKIAEAKAKAAALKEAAAAKATGAAGATAAAGAGVPKAPVKKQPEGPKPADASDHPLVKKLRGKFESAISGAFMFLDQLSIHVEAARVVEVCTALRDDEETPFNYLSDLTCVHWPDRGETPFEVVYNLYSISENVRVRLKANVSEAEGVESVTPVWPTANWMEREVFDLYGVRFRGHPDLRRLLLPPDWEGHPLRKEVPLEFMENNWTAKHLPEFTEVQREQLEQRRAYGLEILSVPDERRIREIFRAGRDPMPLERK